MKKPFLYILNLFILPFLTDTIAQNQPLRIWFDEPAVEWEECVPIGNGRLGAMPDGGVLKENIVLNDITLWSGGIQDADRPDAYKHLPEIQELILDGKNIEAQNMMEKYFSCSGMGSRYGNGAKYPYGTYQLLGNLEIIYNYGIDNSEIIPHDYRRELILDSALASTQFTVSNVRYSREYFASFNNDLIIIKISADQLQKINFTLSLSRPERYSINVVGNEIRMSGQLNNGTDGKGMKYLTRLFIKPVRGEITTSDSSITLSGADAATIYISSATDFYDPDFVKNTKSILEAAGEEPFESEKKIHIKNYQKLYKRASFSLGKQSKDYLPTDERLVSFISDKSDNGLPVLYYQYGRYLLISSTRPGILPPNLQGLWANSINTPWNGDYHLNINVQMNHFPLEVANLGMLNEPFFKLVNSIVANGEKTAKAYYDAEGWVAHVFTNVWGFTSPGEHYSWGSFNTGSAWLCQMLWSHYEFTQDTLYLRKLYPIIKGSAEFYLSSMVKEPTYGWMVTAPSNSPENAFILPEGDTLYVCEGPTIDNQIIRSLFSSVIQASNTLKIDDDFKQTVEKAITQLPPNRIGSDGRLMEWLRDYKEVNPHHRHVSHLWGLYPGNEISMKTPELANAAIATLNTRGDEGTGWSLAWKINFWARLHDGNKAFQLLGQLLRPVHNNKTISTEGGGTYGNLFCAHPPFQIDGNFGGTAGIAEMILQSHLEYIELLPALPNEWSDGSITGWRARRGVEVSAEWKNRKIQHITLTASVENSFKVLIPDYADSVEFKRDGSVKEVEIENDKILVIDLNKGETAELILK